MAVSNAQSPATMMAPSALSVAVIPGDGIGPEVVEVVTPVIERAAQREHCAIRWEAYDWGGRHHQLHGHVMPTSAIASLADHDAALFGAMGGSYASDSESAWGLRLALCQGMNQSVSLRPAFSLEGVAGPLAGRAFDLAVVRENTEGEYSGAGGRVHTGFDHETAVEVEVFTRLGIQRAATYACELASTRRGKLTVVTKSNVLRHTMSLWDEVTAEVAGKYSTVETEWRYVDAVAAQLVIAPEQFDVLLASNAHGDILSDLTGALMGSLGMAGSGNIDPLRRLPAIFEPVHGSAPDLVGTGRANPIGAMRAGAMLLDYCNLPRAATAIQRAIAETARAGTLTPDLGGEATTSEVADAIVARL